jgi:hypothetical protein
VRFFATRRGLIEDLDPEDARAIVDPGLKLMIDAVRHYGGYVVAKSNRAPLAVKRTERWETRKLRDEIIAPRSRVRQLEVRWSSGK